MLRKEERKAILAHAAKGNTALRRVLDDMYERLDDVAAMARRPASPPAAPRQRGGAAEVPLDERIKIAIRALPPEGYGANGKPNVAAIEAALGGENITAADRDRVWAAMQESAE